MSEYAEHPELPPAQHEHADVPPHLLGLGIGLVGLALVLLGGLVMLLFPNAIADRTIAGGTGAWPAPALQASARADMERFAAEQAAQLDRLWWVDRGRGIVHVPIGDAMRRVAREGIADWPSGSVDPRPRETGLRHGSAPAAGVEREMQRNVTEDTLMPATAP